MWHWTKKSRPIQDAMQKRFSDLIREGGKFAAYFRIKRGPDEKFAQHGQRTARGKTRIRFRSSNSNACPDGPSLLAMA